MGHDENEQTIPAPPQEKVMALVQTEGVIVWQKISKG